MLYSSSSTQIRILRLVDGEHNDGVLYRLQKKWVIHFMLGPTLASRDVSIYTNVPDDGQIYDRSTYRKLKWNVPTRISGDKLDDFAPLMLHTAGSFQYYFSYDGKKAGSGYFIVDPTLTVGSDHAVLPLDAVCMQTVLPKLLGKFSTWKERLLVGKESGYNVFHFTPIQELGISKSSYSIADQLKLNPDFSEEVKIGLDDVANLVEEMRRDWQILSVTDVVWNHTAKNSSWLKVNPECAYNLHNSPYLRPAYVLDRALFHLTLDISEGKYDESLKNRQISCAKDLEILRKILETEVIPKLKLHEFFQVDVEKETQKFREALAAKKKNSATDFASATIEILQNKNYVRRSCTVDIDIALHQFSKGNKVDIMESVQSFKDTLVWLNKIKEEQTAKDMAAAIDSFISTVTYERLAEHGPRHTNIADNCPLVTAYFNHPFPDTDVETEESEIMNDKTNSKLIMAYNGWVMGADALKNFAEGPGLVYFRRELICWGDSVKLRYGSKPSDCPVLWERMKLYTESTARVFHGIRIDNCHSTPIHLAEYMLDAARRVRPDLYVFAELFTGSEHVDNIFVNRLGLTSLIREALNAWDSHELGRLVYLYGGEPIASFKQPVSQVLLPCRAHALFYDITHDNDSMITKRTIHDLVPSSALVSMSSCAIGSNRGHDEMIPYHIHVVKEDRLYRKWSQSNAAAEFVGNSAAMIRVKRALNNLHQMLAENGYDQVFVDQRTPDVVAVTRHNPQTHDGYLMIAHTAFKDLPGLGIPPITIEGEITAIALEAKPKQSQKMTPDFLKVFSKDENFLNGIDGYEVYCQSDIETNQSACCKITHGEVERKKVITLTNFPPGSIVVVHVKMFVTADEATVKVRELIENLSRNEDSEFDKIVDKLDLRAFNRVLFHCDEEERSDELGIGVYNIANFGKLPYCGIAGIAIQMAKIRSKNDLGHPICTNLREGNWLLDYLASRLTKHRETLIVGNWYESAFRSLRRVPRFLVPTYFEIIISLTYEKLLKGCWNKMSDFVKNGSTFAKHLALGTVAMCGFIKGSNLPTLHPDVKDLIYADERRTFQICLSMAAGLPHFSSGVMRCWGRDTFIAMHGLQLVTGQYRDARNLILAFAGCLRHGLIPNLLGEGKISRYNCRDAVWFWLQCIQDLCKFTGYELLQMPVARIFPDDDSEPCNVGTKTMPLCEVMQEALQKHADGIEFRERNAGTQIDMNMSNEGFDVSAGVDFTTGFIYGGSQHNCGTWMDKMGESEKAGTKGVPATPRDGSAVELVGLCKSTVSWLHQANAAGKYPHNGVMVDNVKGTSQLTWLKWSETIQQNFEKYFHVSDDDTSHLVHKRHIYKDTVGASQPWCDYQLRPNFPIAMVYAPELFDPQNAWEALSIAQEKLLGPLGMKTLDPDDMQYRGDYDNSNDSDDKSIAKGFNYHQGPEWLWPVGYFLRAKLHFAKTLNPTLLKETIHFIQSYVVKHQLHLEQSEWCGLPELTNSNGSYCRDSCPIQAWSHGAMLDLLYDLSKISD